MNESEFNRLVDETLLAIEEALDGVEADIDSVTSGGILTLSFEDGSQIVINRQTPLRQVWVAARSGGYHLDVGKRAGEWVEARSGRTLWPLLGELCSAQAGDRVELGPD